jgi:hypothetical protein
VPGTFRRADDAGAFRQPPVRRQRALWHAADTDYRVQHRAVEALTRDTTGNAASRIMLDDAARVYFRPGDQNPTPKTHSHPYTLDVMVRTHKVLHLSALVLIRERSSISVRRGNGPDVHGVARSAPSRITAGSGRHSRSLRHSLSGPSWVGAASRTALPFPRVAQRAQDDRLEASASRTRRSRAGIPGTSSASDAARILPCRVAAHTWSRKVIQRRKPGG